MGRPIKDLVQYQGSLPTTSWEQIHKGVYLCGRIDVCQWEGSNCAYKCIDFSEDVARTMREINVREVLRAQYKADHSGVAPILAVALDPETQLIDGILLPLYGESLESFLEHRHCGLKLSHI